MSRRLYLRLGLGATSSTGSGSFTRVAMPRLINASPTLSRTSRCDLFALYSIRMITSP
jgi:hypothetical protein